MLSRKEEGGHNSKEHGSKTEDAKPSYKIPHPLTRQIQSGMEVCGKDYPHHERTCYLWIPPPVRSPCLQCPGISKEHAYCQEEIAELCIDIGHGLTERLSGPEHGNTAGKEDSEAGIGQKKQGWMYPHVTGIIVKHEPGVTPHEEFEALYRRQRCKPGANFFKEVGKGLMKGVADKAEDNYLDDKEDLEQDTKDRLVQSTPGPEGHSCIAQKPEEVLFVLQPEWEGIPGWCCRIIERKGIRRAAVYALQPPVGHIGQVLWKPQDQMPVNLPVEPDYQDQSYGK